MNSNKLLFLLPYLLSLAITTGIFFYAWRHRHVRGASAYVWYVAGQALWGLGYIFELVSPELSGKVFWDQFQWVAGLFITIAFPVFAIQYTDIKIRRPKLLFSLSFVIPSLFLLALFTDNYHHLLYPGPYLDDTVIFSDLKYDFTWVVYAYALYGYLVTLTGLGILIRKLVRPHNLYRRQILTIAIGFFIPIVFTILTVAGVEFKPFRDISPFTFAFGNLVITWGLFRYKLFSVIPIARDLIVDNMDDIVVVLDTQDRVVDINHVALETVNITSAQAVGQPAHIVLADWPELIQQFEHPTTSRTKIAVVTLKKQFHYEVQSTMLYDKRKRYIGRVFIARNVTERIDLENNLKALNAELEERVAKRTEELRESAEQYRELWDATVEGIVIHDQGKILEVNDAICDMLGITREEIIGKTLFDFISTEAHELIRKRIETETPEPAELPIVRADGEGIIEAFPKPIIYQGKTVRVTAIRDITERKQAEETLRESKERLRAIVDEAPFGAHLYQLESDERLVFIGANHSANQILHVDHQQFIGKTIEEAFPPLAETEVPTVYRRVVTSGERFNMDQITYDDAGISGAFEIHAFKTGEKRMAVFFRDITERRRAEDKIAQQLEHLRALHKIDQAIAASMDLKEVLDLFVEEVATQLHVDAVSVLLLDQEQRLNFATGYGFTHTDTLKYTRLPLGQGLAGRAAAERQIVQVDDLQQMTENPTLASAIVNEEFVGYYGVPLIAKDQVRGVLEVFHRSTFAPNPEWLHFLETLAGQAAISIDNATLFDGLEQSNRELKLAYDATLEGWSHALDLRDKETEGHTQRVTEMTLQLARRLGFDEDEIIHIQRGALLHDIGKMGVPDSILHKPGPLTDEEWVIMRKHPEHAYEMLLSIQYLHPALAIPHYHHERWDGSGYPSGLKGEDIPLAARIFAVVDVWDALRSDRPYRKAWPEKKVIEHLQTEAGKYFDPRVVEIFTELLEQGKI